MRNWMRLGLATGFAALIAIASLPEPVDAQTGVAAVKARQAAMKENSKHFGAIRKYLKSGTGPTTQIAADGEAIAQIAAKLPSLFPKGTSTEDLGVKVSGAKPVVWEKWSEFEAASAKLGELGKQVAAAARSGDKKQLADAAGALGKEGCGSCHRTFRQKRPKD